MKMTSHATCILQRALCARASTRKRKNTARLGDRDDRDDGLEGESHTAYSVMENSCVMFSWMNVLSYALEM